jgi:transposase
MAAYSQDLRERVLRGLARGERPVDIARRLEVTRVWVYQVKGRFEASGERCSLMIGGYRRSRLTDKEALLRDWIKAQPDLTLAEMCERLLEQGVAIKVPALWHQLNKWGLSLKKNPARQRAIARRRTSRTA